MIVLDNVIEGLVSDKFPKFAVWVVVCAFAMGMFLANYGDLPARVDALESSERLLDNRLLQQEQKLDLVICFLEMDANGMNPLACSR